VSRPASGRSFRSLVVSGFAWSLGGNVLLQTFRIAFAIALARFLTPHEYGLAGMALVFSTLVMAFSDLSLGVGLVQRKEITEEDRSTVFWTSVAAGIALTAGGVALSGPLASFFGEPEVQPLFAVVAISFVIGSLGATHAALLHREMNFKSITIRVTSSAFLGGMTGVVSAAAGAGAWALIYQTLVIAVVSTTLLWFSQPWRPKLLFSLQSLRDLGGFGGRIFGVRVLEYARTNGDKLLVGRMLGPAALGIYTVAFNIHLLPISRFVVAIQDTMLPALSRLQDERERLAAVWLKATRLVAAILVPTLLGLVVVAPDLIPVLLGERWSEVAPLLQIMAAGVIVLSVSALGFQVLTALDRTKTLLRFSAVEVILLIAALAVGVQWGLTGVALAYAVVHLPTRTFLAWLTTRAVGIPFGRYVRSLTGVVQAAMPMLAAIAATRYVLVEAEVAPWTRLMVVVATGVAVYAPLCLWRIPEIQQELQRLRRRRAARVSEAAAVAH
jgi:O-antigen/teichoic acid export membrane protein